MVTVSHIVNKLVDKKLYFKEAMGNGIDSYGLVAKRLYPDIKKELKKK